MADSRPVAEEEEDTRDVVVCVDDEPAILSALRRLLRRERFEVVTTDDPQQVLELIRERRVRLVIADQKMPEMPGSDLLKEVHDLSPDTLGIVITAFADRGDIAAAMDEGVVQLLVHKPWDDAEFKEQIRGLLASRRIEAPEPEPAAQEPGEPDVVARIDCRERMSYDVLEEVATHLRGPLGRPWRVVFVLGDVLHLGDSVTRFLADLVRIVAASGVRTALVDRTGTAAIFLELMGGFVPVPAFRDIGEMGGRRSVLVIEPREEETDYLRRLIESAGHACRVARSFSGALDALDSESFDLVVLDAPLSDPRGAEAVKGLIREGRRIPVVSLSSPCNRAREILGALAAICRA